MNIWILTSETPHHWAGGIARYVDNFARFAGAAGNRITVISRGEVEGERELAPGYRLIEFRHRFEAAREHHPEIEPDAHPGWPFNNMAYFPALSYQYAEVVADRVAREGPPDVIECQDYAALGYFLLQRKLTDPHFLPDTPVVVHLHTPDFAVQEVNQYPRFKLPDYWTGRMERAAIRMADALLSPSRFIARELGRFLENDAPEVTTVPYPWPDLDPGGVGLPGEDRRLLYPGRLELRKGVEPLLAACEKLWAQGEDFTLEMIGGDVPTPLKGGSLKTYLEKRYKHRIDSGHLKIKGALPHDACLRHMRESTTVIIPSLWENFPNTCIEAMALGKLVIASREGGQAEMVGDDGECGILFSHREEGSLLAAIRLALQTGPEERRTTGLQAHARIQSICSPDRVLDQRMEHFRSVVADHRPKTLFPFTNRRLREGRIAEALPDNPLVSVVIPYYNLGKYLPEALSSVLASEDVRLEVLIINDGSTDPESLEVLESVRRESPAEVRVIDIPNGGLANARNHGAELASGELVAFVDADDRVCPGFFRRALGVLQRYPNVHLAYSWIRFFDGGLGIWHSWNFDLPYLLCHNQLVPIAVVRRDSFLRHGRNKPHIVYGLEDYEGWISMAEAGCGGVAIPEPLAEYRIRSDSMFKVIEPDKKLYLYDLISHEHPDLYREYGLELFNLQNANGPAYGWDQPTMFRGPQDRLLGRLNRAEAELPGLREDLRKVREAETWLQKERRRLSELAGEPLDPS
jgi:glycosyltransferase involved in cell wall biosynthesis